MREAKEGAFMTDNPPSSFASRLWAWLRTLATYDCFPEFSTVVRRFVYHPLGVLALAALASLLSRPVPALAGLRAVRGRPSRGRSRGRLAVACRSRGLAGSITFDRKRGLLGRGHGRGPAHAP